MADGGPDTGAAPGPRLNPGRGDGREPAVHGRAAQRRLARWPGRLSRSVWQQSLSAWREAGLEWQRLAGWEPADADQQRTEPIPVVPAMTTPLDAGLAAASPDGGPARQAGQLRGRHRARRARPGPAGRIRAQPPALRRGGRTVLVGAVACVALLAVAVAGIVIAGRLAARPWPDRAGGGLPVRPAGRWAVRRAGRGSPRSKYCPRSPAWPRLDRTVVAVGSQAALPFARPLVLTSPDGGRTWQSAVLRAPVSRGMPLMVAGGHGRWLAVGPDAAWTSPDGRSWRLGPGIAPLVSGDRVRALAQTRGGFAAVGENVRPVGDDLVRTPVLWMSANGLHLAAPGRGPA